MSQTFITSDLKASSKKANSLYTDFDSLQLEKSTIHIKPNCKERTEKYVKKIKLVISNQVPLYFQHKHYYVNNVC